MTSKSPQPRSKLSDAPPELGLSRKRRGSPTETVATIAAWARALDTMVTLRGEDTYVWVGAVAEVDGCTVLAWDHLDLRAAVELTTRVGLPLPASGEVVGVAPAVLQRAAETLATVAV